MKTSIKISGTSQCGNGMQPKKWGEKQVLKGSKSPSRYLGVVTKNISKKSVRKKIIMSSQCLDSLVQSLSEPHISPELNEEGNVAEYKKWENNRLDLTIDLCDGDGSVEGSSCSNVRHFEAALGSSGKEEVLIDLSNDLPRQNEVIDLTEPCKSDNSLQPSVIDISDDMAKEEANNKSDNDDIHVVGVFSRKQEIKKDFSEAKFIPLSTNWNSLLDCSDKLKKKYLKKNSVLDRIGKYNISKKKKKNQKMNKKNNKNNLCIKGFDKSNKSLARVEGNIYVNSPLTLPSSGLRPIIIDGSNVAFIRSNCNFCCKRLQICINYFKEKGHKVTAFVPQFRMSSHRSDDPQLLRKLEEQGDVILTPSKKIDGKNIVPYDDRFIVQTAVLQGGIIVTRDNYNDLLKENPAWAETIKYRTLAFTWVDDVLMFPKDPLGEFGPSLEEFLRFH